MASFLSANYQIPKKGVPYFRVEGTTVRIRILTDAKPGYMYWNQDFRPVYLRHPPATVPEDIRRENGRPEKVKHFWLLGIWDYFADSVKLWAVTQRSIYESMQALAAEHGHPKDYDFIIEKSGFGLETRYSVSVGEAEPIPADIEAAWKEAGINLESLFK